VERPDINPIRVYSRCIVFADSSTRSRIMKRRHNETALHRTVHYYLSVSIHAGLYVPILSCDTCYWFRLVPNVPAKSRSTLQAPRSKPHAPNKSIKFVFASLSLLHHRIIVSNSKDHICSELTMERLFSPCTRYRDLRESQGVVPPPEWLRELDLNVSTDDFLSAERGFTYADLYTMLRNGDPMTWLTPHAAFVFAHGSGMFYWRYSFSKCLGFTIDGKTVIAWASSHEALS
jgi:hypothetical protein